MVVTLQAGQLAHLPVDLTCTLPVPHTRKNVTLLRAEADAEQLRSAADRDARTATERATERDTAAVDLAQAWRAWTSDAHTSELLGDVEWPVHPVVGPLILDAKALAGDADGDLFGLDQVAAEAARPAQRNKEILRPNEPCSTRPTKPAASASGHCGPSVPTGRRA
jgi:hypothetical protein